MSCIARKAVSGFSTLPDTNQRRWLEAGNRGFRKYKDCKIYAAKTKALISCAITVQQICAFVFAYAKTMFFHKEAQIVVKQ